MGGVVFARWIAIEEGELAMWVFRRIWFLGGVEGLGEVDCDCLCLWWWRRVLGTTAGGRDLGKSTLRNALRLLPEAEDSLRELERRDASTCHVNCQTSQNTFSCNSKEYGKVRT
jgi:hypothetical protein